MDAKEIIERYEAQDRAFHGAMLKRADLSGATLTSADFSNASLYMASLHGADLRGATLSEANLNDADLSDADPPIVCRSLSFDRKPPRTVRCTLLRRRDQLLLLQTPQAGDLRPLV